MYHSKMSHSQAHYPQAGQIPSTFPTFRKVKTIGVTSISSAGTDENFLDNLKIRLESAGYNIRIIGNITATCGVYADTHENRAKNLHSLFLDPEIDAIISTRGGEGACFLLPYLDKEIITQNPKPLFGYSDITLCLNLLASWGLPTFHAGMFGDYTTDNHLKDKNFTSLLLALDNKWQNQDLSFFTSQAEIVQSGRVIAPMVGGCLTLIRDTIGTPYQINFDHKILFMEDVGEPLYKIDQMIQQLKASGILKNIKGIIAGEFVKIKDDGIPYHHNATEIIKSHFFHENIPIITNTYFGHGPYKPALPMGATYEVIAPENNADSPIRITPLR